MSDVTSRSLIGHFYFKLTTSGNLLGEFGNNTLRYNQTECADRSDGCGKDRTQFLGTYDSVWWEYEQEDGGATLATLTIDAQQGATNVFELTWQVRDPGAERYVGRAMVADGDLKGSYWQE